ncbi:MAG: hypothetical protein HY840_00195 [Bacteroidetes bacterium]|nr:hypothetical protein [Bacteroidota bacterium]
MKFALIFLFLIPVCLVSCRKKSKILVHGIVFSTGTGNGLPNIEVQFYTIKDKLFSDKCNYLVTKTDANGNFSFPDVEIIDNGKYTYGLDVPYYSNSDYTMFGIGPIDIDIDDLSNNQILSVTATFKDLTILLPENVIVQYPDSFTATFENRIYHNYLPDNIWQLVRTPKSFHSTVIYPNNLSTNFPPYSIGWWHITFDKIKNGVQSVFQDSIYLGMGETKEYVLPW